MSLVDHARRELELAGLFDKDADYGGMIGTEVLKLVEALASGGHSGGSAEITLAAFDRVARFKTLTPLTSDPADWVDVSEASGGKLMWQSRRSPSVFSTDGGQTWYDLDSPPQPVLA